MFKFLNEFQFIVHKAYSQKDKKEADPNADIIRIGKVRLNAPSPDTQRQENRERDKDNMKGFE
jgi:hypothetical protein